MGPLEFRRGVLDAADRHERIADEAVGGDGAVVLSQECVVRLHHRQVRLAVRDPPDEPGREDRREEHLGVDAVAVLLLQALDSAAGTLLRVAVPVEIGAVGELHRPRARHVLPCMEDRLTLDDPGIALAVGEVDEPWRSIAVALRNVLDPRVGWCLDMAVAGYHAVLAAHGVLSVPGRRRRRRVIAHAFLYCLVLTAVKAQSPNAMTVRPAATTTRPPPAAGAMKREGTAPICLEKIRLPVAGLTASSTPDSVDTDQMAPWVMMAGPGLEVGDVHFTLKRSPVTETAATLPSHDT